MRLYFVELIDGFFVVAGRLTVIMLGLSTLAIGIILSSTPWLDYLILKVSAKFNC